MDKLLEELAPAVVSIVGILGTAFLGWLGLTLRTKFGIDMSAAKKAIEAGDREALHWALETAAKLAVSRGLVGQAAVDFVLQYIRSSAPDALRGLEPARSVLQNLAESKLAGQVELTLDNLASKHGVDPDVLRRAIQVVSASDR